jgi:heme-degrading monooxygenase HmoA
MILEHALFAIKEGQGKDFEGAFVLARTFLESAEGCRKAEMRACIERDDSYLLLVWWDSLEAHTKGFRESQNFVEWRAILGPYFAAPPQVHHYEMPI